MEQIVWTIKKGDLLVIEINGVNQKFIADIIIDDLDMPQVIGVGLFDNASLKITHGKKVI